MLNSNLLASNPRIEILGSLRPERVQAMAEAIFPELRDIARASSPEERDSLVQSLRQRLSAEPHRELSPSEPL